MRNLRAFSVLVGVLAGTGLHAATWSLQTGRPVGDVLGDWARAIPVANGYQMDPTTGVLSGVSTDSYALSIEIVPSAADGGVMLRSGYLKLDNAYYPVSAAVTVYPGFLVANSSPMKNCRRPNGYPLTYTASTISSSGGSYLTPIAGNVAMKCNTLYCVVTLSTVTGDAVCDGSVGAPIPPGGTAGGDRIFASGFDGGPRRDAIFKTGFERTDALFADGFEL